MSRRLVGVELGATEVRVVEIDPARRGAMAAVKRVGLASYGQPNTVVAGRIKKPAVVAYALTQAIKSAGVPRHGFVIGLGTPSVGVTQATLPDSTPVNARLFTVRQMAGSGAKTQIELPPGLSVESAALAIDTATARPGQLAANMRLLSVAAANGKDVEDIRRVCQLAQCTPAAIDLSAAATLRATVQVPSDDYTTAAVIDIGASQVTVAVRRGATLESVSCTAGLAGDHLTRAVAGAAGLDDEQAQERKHRMRVGAVVDSLMDHVERFGTEEVQATGAALNTEIENVLSEEAVNLVESIAETIDASLSDGTYIQGAVLTGGGSLLGGFRDLLHQRLGVPVHIGRPFATVVPHKRTSQLFADGTLKAGHEDPRQLLRLTTAIGHAMWKEPA